jgi:hypothetical protein
MSGSFPAWADSIDDAYKICAAADSTGVTSQPCSVSGRNVDIYVDASGSTANEICRAMANLMFQQGVRFDRGWKIRIYSPFSGGNTIAQCPLP